MRFFKDLSIGRKLYGSFTIVAILFMIAVVVGWSSVGSVAQTVKDGNAAAITAGEASAAAYNMHVSQAQNVADGGRVVQMHHGDMAVYEKAVARLRAQITTARERAALATVDASYANWKKLDDEVSATWRKGDFKQAGQLLDGAANTASDDLSNKLASLGKSIKDGANRDAASAQSSAKALMATLTALALILAAGISFLVTRVIRRGVATVLDRSSSLVENDVAALQAGLGAMAGGDLTQTLDPTTEPIAEPARDEIGQVQTAVNAIREQLVTSIQAFNETGDRLRSLIGDVSVVTTQVGSSSQQMATTSEEAGKAVGEIATAVGDVAAGAERQVRQVESVRGSADEAATAARTSAEQAQEAATVAEQARLAARDGVGAAEQATLAMHAVRDSSQSVTKAIRDLAGKSGEIGAIVETITGIAGQTNLLALNAAIEAARAGEQGRGFAVVAEEVRKLAEESQKAAEEISALIGQIQGDTQDVVGVVEDGAERTEQGAATVEQTREAFVRIGEAVEDVSSRIAEIAGAAEQISVETDKMQGEIAEVAAVAEQSSASTEEVSASTEQTSASAQEIAASAQELAATAEGLGRLVSQFKVEV
ncbi:MAG: methyl-accepting chemotaxis protein [Thermoleophilaceae bacterium]|nr:methyl-accepting chemotaxis protein [Thermoleophilaceae bacterium]